MQQAILISGAFDLLHPGHEYLLKTAKALAVACGGFVVCLINSDDMIRASKGLGRPRQSAKQRQDAIFALGVLDFSDTVEVFHSENELNSLCEILTPIRILGSDYIDMPVTGAKYCKHVFYIKRTNDSTTERIQSITAG